MHSQTQPNQYRMRFEVNMLFFKAKLPLLHEQFQHYKPSKILLKLDRQGKPNLFHIRSQSFIYQGDAQSLSRAQVEQYMSQPKSQVVHVGGVEDEYFEQIKLVNQLNKDFKAHLGEFKGDISSPVSLLLVNGCGLGFHIKRLFEMIELRHLFVFEAHNDIFYASLFVFDWAWLFNQAKLKGCRIHLYINKNKSYNAHSLHKFIETQGLYNTVNPLFFEHMADNQLGEVKANFTRMVNGFGFLEDEQLSIAHTVYNLRRKIPILINHETNTTLPPVFIIGNGPSLDSLVDTIKQYQDKAIIVSAGTALASLEKANIKPDIHIEMERTAITYEALKNGTSAAFRKGITFIGLNCIHPEIFKLFKKRAMVLKVYDAGAEMVKAAQSETFKQLFFANPTVVNAASNFVLMLGFRQLYFMGVDFGMPSSEAHHSRFSPHYDKQNKTFEKFKPLKADFKVKGNFQSEVYSNFILNMSNQTLASCLKHFKDAYAYNLNDGAYIHRARPLRKEDIAATLEMAELNKDKVVSSLLDKHFKVLDNSKAYHKATLLKNHTKLAIDTLMSFDFAIDKASKSQLFDCIDYYQKTLLALKNDNYTAFVIINGTCQTLFHIVLMMGLSLSEDDDFLVQLNRLLKLISEFYAFVKHLLTKDLLSIRDH